jgi:tRNA (mo5U34)-methyltransferase
VVYESLAGLPVTANVYLPASGGGRRPAIIASAGHAQPLGKEAERWGPDLARKGFVVLAYDPLPRRPRPTRPGSIGRIRRVMDARELRSQVASLRWYHTIDLGGGVVTPGADETPLRLARLDLPASLAGKTVLDVGAWDGFFSFEAERRGAARVVATDSYSWRGEGWGTKAGFELARRALGSRVEDIDVDVMDLTPERAGVFDVVLLLGVLYHLRHPLLALERLAAVTRELLVLETVVDMVGVSRPAMAFYPGRELNRDPTNWWGPNPAAVRGMLETVGFSRVRTVTPIRSAPYRALRAVSHRLRGKNRLGPAFRQDRAVFHAARDRGETGPQLLNRSTPLTSE